MYCKHYGRASSFSTDHRNSYSADIVGDVSYDAFLGDSSCGGPGSQHVYEVMVRALSFQCDVFTGYELTSAIGLACQIRYPESDRLCEKDSPDRRLILRPLGWSEHPDWGHSFQFRGCQPKK